MGDTAAAIIASTAMVSCTTLVVVVLIWHLANRQLGLLRAPASPPPGSGPAEPLTGQDQLRADVSEVADRVRAIQRLLEDAAE